MGPTKEHRQQVQQCLESVPAELRRLVEALRGLVLDVAPNSSETVLWKSLSYHCPDQGGRVKGAVCLITPREDCIHVGFIHGAFLPDPTGLLRGDGKSKRYTRVDSVECIPREALAKLIRAAIEYRPR